MTVVGELARYKLHLVGVQKVRWDKAGTTRAGDYTFSYGPLGKPRRRWEDNIKIDLREVVWGA
jgi:hypothetical protein